MWLSMNTNGGAKMNLVERIGPMYGRKGAVIFSVDGSQDTNPYTGRTWFGIM